MALKLIMIAYSKKARVLGHVVYSHSVYELLFLKIKSNHGRQEENS